VLIEKAKTTPAAYPMTVNAIVAGCNQKSNRDPITTLDDFDVEKTLGQLQALHVVSEIDWMGRVSKYKHHGYEWLGVSSPEMAVMAELLLRGAQALGDLRARAARMETIADLAALKPIVDGLIERGLMIALTLAGRGQIVSHNLYPPTELVELKSRHSGHTPGALEDAEAVPSRHSAPPAGAGASISPPRFGPEIAGSGESADRVARLSAEVAELGAEVARLRQKIADLEARLAALG
jgi:uncharacterized protein YceH (UPF0502 family)